MIPRSSTPIFGVCSEVHMSVQQCAEEEAKQFKWIKSEEEGRDLGETAIRMWIRQHWNGFLRHRWLEHLLGKTFWIELDLGDFGLLQKTFLHSKLIDPILEHLKKGRENLDIIVWAIERDYPMEEVYEILEILDINSRRIECQFDPTGKRVERVKVEEQSGVGSSGVDRTFDKCYQGPNETPCSARIPG
jgi:hypothetical protein